MKYTLLILFIIPAYLFSQTSSEKLFSTKNSPLSQKSITAIATEKGVISHEGDSWRKHRLKNKRSLIISLFVDAFDNKWICTSNNIIVFNNEGVEFKNNITNENSVVVSK